MNLIFFLSYSPLAPSKVLVVLESVDETVLSLILDDSKIESEVVDVTAVSRLSVSARTKIGAIIPNKIIKKNVVTLFKFLAPRR